MQDEFSSFEQSVPASVLEALDVKERKRQQVIFELIQTEGAYVVVSPSLLPESESGLGTKASHLKSSPLRFRLSTCDSVLL